MSQKIYFVNFYGYLHEIFTGIEGSILSHPVTSKQPDKIFQILMRHPALQICAGKLQ